MGKEQLSRRDVLKLLLASGVAVGGGERVAAFMSQFNFVETNLTFLEGAPLAEPALPRELRGTALNSPYLWTRSPQYVRSVLAAAHLLGVSAIRIFIEDAFEPQVGHYNFRIVDQVKQVVRMVAEHNQNQPATRLSLILSLFDAYLLLHSQKWNMNHAPKPLVSPYLKAYPTVEAGQRAFFNDRGTRAAFIERETRLVTEFIDEPEVAAWEVANELEVPFGSQAEKRAILTDWYRDVVGVLRAADEKRPIVTGLSQPWLIEDSALVGMQVVNSLHLYPQLDRRQLTALRAYVPRAKLPLVLSEIGVSSRWGSGPADSFLPAFTTEVLQSTILNRRLHLGHVGFWKLDAYEDSYSVDPARFPGTAGFISRLGSVLRRL